MLILLFLFGAASACEQQYCGYSCVWMYEDKVVDKTLAEYCPDDDPNRVTCTVEECKMYYMDGIISFCFVSFDLIIDLRLKFEI